MCLFFVSVSIFVGTQGYNDCLYFQFLYRSLFDDALVRSFPVGTCDWHVYPSSTLQVGLSVPLFFSYRSAMAVLSAKKFPGDEVSVSYIPQNHSRVVVLLKLSLDSMPFLVNNGYDKPSKY